MQVERLERLVTALGGWPDHFDDMAKGHGLSILAQLDRARFVDEGVFGLVVRYGMHRAAFDRLSGEIKEASKDTKTTSASNHFLTGPEQARAFHENKLAALEKQLLATPYERIKAGQNGQGTFLPLFDAPSPDDGAGTEKKNDNPRQTVVTPFKPVTRRVRVNKA